MIAPRLQQAIATLASSVDTLPGVEDELRARWSDGIPGDLPRDVRTAADELQEAMLSLLQDHEATEALAGLLATPARSVILLWCTANAWRDEIAFARLLRGAAREQRRPLDDVAKLARRRVIEGPLLDALRCAPLIGQGADLASAENVEACARLEILVWEAGATALRIQELGRWLWGSEETFDALVRTPAHGALRGRVLAARRLEVAADGMPEGSPLVGRTLAVLQPLLFHPEPLVWLPAARALGRLTGTIDQLEGTLLDWVMGDAKVLRQRAITAFACLRARQLKMFGRQLQNIIEAPDDVGWVLAAVAAATPYLFFERNDLFQNLSTRVLGGDGGSIAARALARGLAALFRRGLHQDDIERPLRALRERARRARPDSLEDARRWIEVIAVTDPIDGAERDPLDLEIGLENLVRVAARYDDVEADARAARFAGSVAQSFGEAHRLAIGAGTIRARAAAMNALEGCARSFALRLWRPLLATSPTAEHVEEPSLEEAWKILARAPADILDHVTEARRARGSDAPELRTLEVLAVRIGGYALDACGEGEVGPRPGEAAHQTCLWLRKLDALAGAAREVPPALQTALGTLLWRLVDTTRGTSLGEVDDVRWLGPFAAWWALVIDRPAMLLQLATALPIMEAGALARCCEQADALRTALSSGQADGTWGDSVAATLAELHAEDTELAEALADLSRALAAFAGAASNRPSIDDLCLQLVFAGERLQGALADPVRALHAASEASREDSLSRRETENAPRIAALVARAIRSRDVSMLEVWLASLGPIASVLLEQAVQGAMRRSPPPPPPTRKPEVKLIEGYELIAPLGEGGIGSVWLVRKPGADRLFVLKIPKADALASATPTEREGILASFVEEAKALAGLYHPNVANIIDRGVSSGVPFLVLEYLIGADLRQYSMAQKMSLFELRTVVLEACAGLDALHRAGLVHRDIKPANIWLRLPLSGGERFDPGKHRDPARVQPLSSVVIDFGMVRATRIPPAGAGRFVTGTVGYIAPEQVLDPVELDPRADVYALAGTLYNVTTGRSFFDEIEGQRDRILAHLRRDPFEDPERLRGFPAAIAKVLREATLRNPGDRPSPMELGRAFAAAL
ncbi:MAG: serine/threonine protein kinase [Deltaproteobacteria bacterium]|nr:serine/threonine protein kinase [Deltaproteobacteria bacterium]